MKKFVSVFVLATVLLTGCGNAAGTAVGTAESSAPASETAKQSEDPKEDKASSEQEFHDWWGIEMPVPQGMELFERLLKSDMYCWIGGTESDPVYYAMEFSYEDEYLDESKGHTLADLPEALLWVTDDFLYRMCDSNTNKDFSKVAVDSSTEEQFLGFPALCQTGTFTTYEDAKIHYKAYYAYLDYPRNNRKHVPSVWFAFTQSDDKDALKLMNEAADAPLPQARLRESD